MILGITGRAGSGKSFAQEWIHTHTPIEVIDLDIIGHDLLEKEVVIEELVVRFGKKIITKEGKVERRKLSNIVFSQPKALDDLNKIMHPKIYDEVNTIITTNKNNHFCIVGALIKEINLISFCDFILTIDAKDADIRRYSKKSFKIANLQRSRHAYIKDANIVIQNTFSETFIFELRKCIKNVFPFIRIN
jgi:dephospho-CoA kinase